MLYDGAITVMEAIVLENVILIQGAREHNLQQVTVTIPKNKLVVLTGPSGSGKSTLAMDTLFKECQRQYLESMGMQGIDKPKVDTIRGLSPAISVNQHVTNRNPRSSVGTVTDMYTSLRMVFEKLGHRHCPNCHWEIKPTYNTSDIDRGANRFTEYIHCPHCHYRMEKLTRTHFSYNTAEGACPTCKGLGSVISIHTPSVFHADLSIENGAVDLWKGRYGDYQVAVVKTALEYYGVPIGDDLPLHAYRPEQISILYYGTDSDEVKEHFANINPPKTVAEGKFEGVLTGMWRRYSEKSGQSAEGDAYFYSETCPDCEGERLNSISREVTVRGKTIPKLVNRSLEEMLLWIEEVEKQLEENSYLLTEMFIQDLKTKLKRIIKMGLGYLTLDRQVITLSGGEMQRLRLSSLLDSSLTGVLYVMDEPTMGLHPKDTMGLVSVMKELRDLNNTVLVIEHDVDVMREADYLIDMGPGAGKLGGKVVGQGTLSELVDQENSVTGSYLREEEKMVEEYRSGTGEVVTVTGATLHNLKSLTVSFPIGCLIAVTGVSGSGKSSLVFGVLSKGQEKIRQGFSEVSGLDHFDEIVTVGQSPLSRMKRSNVATYTDLFTSIRNVFAKQPIAKEKGLTAKHFSFNTTGGRCENCQGLGYVTTNMLFFPDLEVTCPVCRGKRFKEDVLSVTYDGYNVNDILECSIQEALPIFAKEMKVKKVLDLLVDIGLGYLKLGQSLTTLSGGEGQRLKLSKELLETTKKKTLYLLDEPTTGLHPVDVRQLLNILHRLVDAGNTVIVVEHNSELIKSVDWIVDMGPEGGEKGGQVIAEGTPREIKVNKKSITGRYL